MTAEEFKQARLKHYLTQKRLGELLGYKGRVAETIVQKWEYGERPIPMKHFRQLSKLLEIPLEKFIP